jgi:trigger factor
MTEGQQKSFSLSVPDDHHQGEYAGKECRFEVEVVAVKEKRLPELDDEFAKGVRDGFESMEALSEHVRQRLTEDGEATAQRELERNVLEEVKKLAKIQASELIYQREIESIREDHERSLRNQRLDLDTYLRFVGQTEQEWEEQLRPQAEDRLATFLIMRKLAEQESVEVEADEIDSEIDRLTENSAEESVANLRQILNSEDSRESLRSSLLNRKVLARLVEIAVSNDPAPAEFEDESGDEPDPESSPDEGPEQTSDEGATAESEPVSESESDAGEGGQSDG